MDFKKITPGTKAPKEVNVVIEIPQGSGVKYELDKKSGAMFVDRFICASSIYPFNYGFIPGSKSDDGDPLDVMAISSAPVQSGTVMRVRPIGVLLMEDEKGEDAKVIAVPAVDVDLFYSHISDISDVDETTQKKIMFFFSRYKEFDKGKWAEVHGFRGRDEAFKEIRKSLKKTFKKRDKSKSSKK